MARVLKTRSDWLSVGTEARINELKYYLETSKKQLEYVASDYDKGIKAQAQKIKDEQEREEFYEWSGEQHWNYTKTFPRILLNSFHVTAYSLLESEIYSLASLLGKKQQQLFDVSDFVGRDYLRKASYYIEKTTNIKPQSFRSWNLINDGRDIRNIIVHSNGILAGQHAFDLAKKYGFIDESTIQFPSGRSIVQLSITYEYCQAYLLTLKRFFNELYSGIKAGNFL